MVNTLHKELEYINLQNINMYMMILYANSVIVKFCENLNIK